MVLAGWSDSTLRASGKSNKRHGGISMNRVLCDQCGSSNEAIATLCANCGALLPGRQAISRVDRIIDVPPPRAPAPSRPPAPPRWTHPAPITPVILVPQAVAFSCPYCNSPYPPLTLQRITTGGWVVFVILLLFCLPLCWLGLLIKEDYRVCSSCRMLV